MTRTCYGLTMAAIALFGLCVIGCHGGRGNCWSGPDGSVQLTSDQTSKVVRCSDGVAPDANRADCPGRIICPLTGKPVCRDKCPLHAKQAGETPPCCRKKTG